MKEKQARIDKAIAMKEKSIAYFNSVNAAISLLAQNIEGKIEAEEMKKSLVYWRDWFFSQWRAWYMEETIVKYTGTSTEENIEWQKDYNRGSKQDERILEIKEGEELKEL